MHIALPEIHDHLPSVAAIRDIPDERDAAQLQISTEAAGEGLESGEDLLRTADCGELLVAYSEKSARNFHPALEPAIRAFCPPSGVYTYT